MHARRGRDYQAERRERDSFVLLQHVYTVTEGSPTEVVRGRRIAEELCFANDEIGELIEHLVRVGYFSRCSGDGDPISITPLGAEYIERLAWRRRTVREG